MCGGKRRQSGWCPPTLLRERCTDDSQRHERLLMRRDGWAGNQEEGNTSVTESCCMNTTYSECTDGSVGSGVTLLRPLLSLSGPRLLVRASVLMRAKAKGATQRNVHTATMRLTDSSLQADWGDWLVFRPSGSTNTEAPMRSRSVGSEISATHLSSLAS